MARTNPLIGGRHALIPLVLFFLCTIAPSLSAAVVYTFTGTNIQGKAEAFRYRSPGFISAVTGVLTAQMETCSGCSDYSAAIFAPKSVNGFLGDQIDFSDSNGAGYAYMFPLGAFGKAGTYRAGVIPPNAGTLTVEVTDDLAVTNSAGYGYCGAGGGVLCLPLHISPGEAATIFGSDRIPGTVALADSVPLPTQLGGDTVTLVDAAGKSRTAQLSYVSPLQVNFVVPPETALGPARIVMSDGTRQASLTTTITAVAPGIFTANGNGAGVAAAQIVRSRRDQAPVTEGVIKWDPTTQEWIASPIAIGADVVHLVLYATGIRNRAGPLEVHCWCGNAWATFQPVYAGPQGQFAGLDQVNLRLPATLDGSGSAYLWLAVDGEPSNLVTITFR